MASTGMPQNNRFIDLTGHTYNQVTVLEYSHSRRHYNKKGQVRSSAAVWKCRCACGKEFETTGNSLRMGHTKSCGCIRKGRVSPHRGEFGVSSSNLMLTRYKKSAEAGGHEFSLAPETFFLIGMQDCVYCGAGPKPIKRPNTYYGTAYFTGIDRVNRDLGYTTENCVPCCSDCNYMKQETPVSEFKEQIKRIFEFWASK